MLHPAACLHTRTHAPYTQHKSHTHTHTPHHTTHTTHTPHIPHTHTHHTYHTHIPHAHTHTQSTLSSVRQFIPKTQLPAFQRSVDHHHVCSNYCTVIRYSNTQTSGNPFTRFSLFRPSSGRYSTNDHCLC